METPNQIIELINHFESQKELYHSGKINETQTRIEFIDPFFEILGWDVSNKQQASQVYQDVVHEERLQVHDSKKLKAPDYSFRIKGVRKFFVEAKKSSINLENNISAAFQLRRYGWSAKLPISILTDFEELAIYDCTIMPHKNDSAKRARIKYYQYTEYREKWTEIYNLLSKEAVLNGSLERLQPEKIKEVITVDQAFLAEIETWRSNLANNLVLTNPNIQPRNLNFAVQMTINRIVFLRICEDRGIEPYEQLFSLLKLKNIYQELGRLFQNADYRYNSGLFHFQPEKGRESYDDFTLNLTISDLTLRPIIKRLYYPESPYEFSVIPVEILGQVYEQFLGKVITLSASRQVIVEDKPEVRKAGGVYYTPSYIVDYIIKHTIGKLLEGKQPEEINNFTILDPACGSGSFLVVAYQFMLDWYLEQYSKNPKKYKQKIYQATQTSYQLTSPEKKRILVTHIYGVDIDKQAVETTKLSLLLRVLEGESGERITQQLRLFKERALPDLDKNILCGNSLIGTDYYSTVQLDLLDEDEIYRVNVFDWDQGFPAIMKRGGFDVIIGNPPYGALFTSEDINYLIQHYPNSPNSPKGTDSYTLFMELGLSFLLKSNGYLGLIISNTWEQIFSGSTFRKYIVNNYSLVEIVHFLYKVFNQVTVDCEILIINKTIPQNNDILIKLEGKNQTQKSYYIKQASWIAKNGDIISVFENEENQHILSKIESVSDPLESICYIKNGVKPFEKGKGQPPQTDKIMKTKPFVAKDKKDDTFKPLLRGSLINRYCNYWNENYWISYGIWLAAPRQASIFFDVAEKIVIRQTGDSLIATIIDNSFVCRNNLHIIYNKESCHYNLKYILGLINSKVLNFYYHIINPEFGETFAEVKASHVKRLPIYRINFKDQDEVKKYNQIIKLVDQIFYLHQLLKRENVPLSKQMFQRQIKATDAQIDQLVYQLYGLTDAEIKIIEES